MNRTGTCNRCGSCCTPDEGFPVPKNWPDVVRNWLAVDVSTHIPHLGLVGLGAGANGELVRITDYGNYNLGGHKVYWRWKQGLCTNLEPYDSDNCERVCPLLEKEKFGRRECSLVGTHYENWYLKNCNDMAPLEFTQAERDAWLSNHPLCGYDWE